MVYNIKEVHSPNPGAHHLRVIIRYREVSVKFPVPPNGGSWNRMVPKIPAARWISGRERNSLTLTRSEFWEFTAATMLVAFGFIGFLFGLGVAWTTERFGVVNLGPAYAMVGVVMMAIGVVAVIEFLDKIRNSKKNQVVR